VVVQFSTVASIDQHGEQLSGLGRFEVIENPIVLVLAVIAAIFVASRQPWARSLAVIVELLAIINGIINMASGLTAGIGAIALAFAVIAQLSRPETIAWSSRSH
jgi:hypothetical protein